VNAKTVKIAEKKVVDSDDNLPAAGGSGMRSLQGSDNGVSEC